MCVFSEKTKVFLRRIKYPDICLTGGMCYDVFYLNWRSAPTKEVYRF